MSQHALVGSQYGVVRPHRRLPQVKFNRCPIPLRERSSSISHRRHRENLQVPTPNPILARPDPGNAAPSVMPIDSAGMPCGDSKTLRNEPTRKLRASAGVDGLARPRRCCPTSEEKRWVFTKPTGTPYTARSRNRLKQTVGFGASEIEGA